jgi:hypothetical protein
VGNLAESGRPIDRLRGSGLHMSQDNLAQQSETGGAGGPDDALYDALLTALRGNARGRAFLDEYARRARQADTLAALAALARIEALLLRQGAVAPGLEAAPLHEISSDDAYVPFEFEPLPDAIGPANTPASDIDQVLSAAPIELAQPPSSADLLAQVMALSPEERIALFS